VKSVQRMRAIMKQLGRQTVVLRFLTNLKVIFIA
jgi:hypothetical protein